jgi:fumarate hydratase class II
MNLTRIESDSMGPMEVPSEAYYGAQTARAKQNFPISNLRFGREFIRALGLIKKHSARVNAELGLLPEPIAHVIQSAAAEVAEGKLDAEFVVDVFQTGSGTSTNMNANEVIANRALELLGLSRGDKTIHPNDHVNRGQSSNDVIPSAIHLAAWETIVQRLIPSLQTLRSQLEAKASEFMPIIKIGRTHLQDATPIRLGQEFHGYGGLVGAFQERLTRLEDALGQLALGGTAVGTGINTHPEFARRVVAGLATETGLNLQETNNHFSAQSAIDACVDAAGVLAGGALSLTKIANDIRWLGSGPRCGVGELRLPATQPGSSMMPGKVNPVMSEMLIQVAARVVGNNAAISFAAVQGAFELNTMLPVAAHSLLESIQLLARGAEVFAIRCVAGLQADEARCAYYVEQSLALCTALVPEIGYDLAAKVAKHAAESGGPIRQSARELTRLSDEQLNELLDLKAQTHPS